ncbi:MAG: DUF4465 domain-containing protein [Planctomycetaceae bacterium]|jgi:hypothetical protein|nr:DUF4465 domain-containing protein [Planctomycetaceae bacterium]
MKKFTLLFVLCACLLGLCVTGNVFAQPVIQTVVVDFEEFAEEINEDGEDHGSENGWSWNGTNDRYYSGWFPEDFGTWNGLAPGPYGMEADELAYQSNGVTFYILPGSDSGMNFWFGTGLSTVTDTTFASYLNEMASITGSGADDSAAYAVVYGDSTIDLEYDSPYNPRISLPPGVTLQSVDITNTVYTYGCLTNIDPFGFATPLSQNGDFFNLIIHGVRSNGTLVNSITVPLGRYENDTLYVLTDWETIDLSSLTGSTELRFSFDGNDIEYGLWLNQPVYFAFDNLTYIPAVP